MEDGKGTRKKEARSATISVRLEPKYRYLAELAARRQRRTLSSFLEWAVEDVLKRELLVDSDRKASNLAEEANYLWCLDPAERFVRLASRFESLLNHEEQILWKLIQENDAVHIREYKKKDEGTVLRKDFFDLSELEKHWESFLKVARGEASPDTLPKICEAPRHTGQPGKGKG